MGLFGNIGCKIGMHKWSEWEYKSPGGCDQERVCSRGCGKKETRLLHVWGQWDYEAENSCRLWRKCQRCQCEEKGEEKHRWNEAEWEYMSTNATEKEQVKDRITKRIDGLRQEHETNIEKLTQFRKDFAIKSDSAVKFELKKGIEATEKELERIEGDLNSWEPRLNEVDEKGGNCQQRRLCPRCNKEETRIHHTWGKWEYESSISCRLIRYCQRCGESQMSTEEPKHQWEEWKYESPTSCRQIRYCRRCAQKDSKYPIEHKWGKLELDRENPTSCRLVRYCQHCGDAKMTGKETRHQWGEWEQWDDNQEYKPFDAKRICTRCKFVEYGQYSEGKITISIFSEMYYPIYEYLTQNGQNIEINLVSISSSEAIIKTIDQITNFSNQQTKTCKLVIKAIDQVVDFNNQRYPEFPIHQLPGIKAIVTMLIKSPDKDIRVSAMNGLIKLRRIESRESEETLKEILEFSAQKDSSRKIKKNGSNKFTTTQ